MGKMQLSAEEFNETYNKLNNATNTKVIDSMKSLATLLKQHEGESAILDQALENCRTLADAYNGGFYDSLVSIKKTFDNFFELSEYMEKKANIGEVSKVDTGFEAGKFDASSVMV